MPAFLRRPTARAALFAALAGLVGMPTPAAAAFDPLDLPIAVKTCPQFGRDPSVAQFKHSCGVWRPGGFAANPGWNGLEVLVVDRNAQGGGVVATLNCMSRTTGAVSAVARVRSGPTGADAARFSVPLAAPMDFNRCAYFVDLDVNGTAAPVQALMVSLVRR